MLLLLMIHSLFIKRVHAFGTIKTQFKYLKSTKLSCFDSKLGNLPTDASTTTATRDDYLFGNKTSFIDLGVLPNLGEALSKVNRPVATAIQAATFAEIISGRDTVIAAETGSGKTFAFLVPILHMLLEDNFRESIHYPSAVICVPNKELCSQVHRMASELLDAVEMEESGKVSCGIATSTAGSWPYRIETAPDILICTPAFLAKFVRGPNILDEDLFRSIRHFVLDEADMLLEGSYLIDIERVLDAFKLIRRQMIHAGEIQVHSTVLQVILSAATLPSYGLRSMEKYIESRFPLAKWISNEHLHKHHPRIIQNYLETPGSVFLTKDRMSLIIKALFNQPIEEGDTNISFLKTLPKDAVSDMVQPEDPTMIFVNTAEVAVELAESLRKLGIQCAEFHKLQIAADKQGGLQQFRDSEIKTLVCTDHAARGLDLPHVKHVIQAEFALNVVQHLHRIGRASRAGALGRATNIVDDRSAELVDSILSDEETRRVDQSFSRRRGFRNKIKKAVKRSREEGSAVDETDKEVIV